MSAYDDYLGELEAYHAAGQHGRMAPAAVMSGEKPPPPPTRAAKEVRDEGVGVPAEEVLRYRAAVSGNPMDASAGGFYFAVAEKEAPPEVTPEETKRKEQERREHERREQERPKHNEPEPKKTPSRS